MTKLLVIVRRRGYKFLFYGVNKKIMLRFAFQVQCTTGQRHLLSYETKKQKCILRHENTAGFEYSSMALKLTEANRYIFDKRLVFLLNKSRFLVGEFETIISR